ncbi:SAM-dependent methyltransferase [candidate division KSB1 bacterium]|nr:SAM-dependent methyltransferase [candidate division KSB1 bacterium]
MTPKEVIDQLGYKQVPENWVTEDNSEPATAHLWRSAKKAHVLGTYVFRASPQADSILPPRPAIHVARASTETEAREIHRNLWNLGAAPFLIVILPHQVRVYSGFDYSQKKQSVGLLCTAELTPDEISAKLKDFYAEEIDSGRIWQTQAENLTPDKRVDRHLLKNLEKLGKELADEKYKIDQAVAHALIGKYIYLRYLEDRKILSDEWLRKHGIGLEDVTGRNASLTSLRKLTEALEDRFNGGIFPLSFTGSMAPSNDAVKYVASVFRGDDPTSGQLALDFKAYDFSYIPIETLSSIYEQFLHAEGKGKGEGAIYTREFVADYLLCEINSVKPLKKGMKVLDPACGSGIFLVLAYRRLIEGELSKRKKKRLSPTELRQILEESIFGVERSREASYVTEFSLILTLLSYVEPPELHENESFKFPDLHNRHIFECDFFDNDSKFWKKNLAFDWILGKPPWIKLDSATADQEQKHAWKWITDNLKQRPIGQYSLCEAFSWRATDILSDRGCIGLLIHATSLFNKYSAQYRQKFFILNEVKRITNFSNLAYILFAGSAQAPAATIVYTRAKVNQRKSPIVHYGPFVANQIFNYSLDEISTKKSAWTLTIHEDEIQTIDPYNEELGSAKTWKLALWGTYRDKKAISLLKRMFPNSLNEVKKVRGWRFREGLELRNCMNNETSEEIEYVPELAKLKRLNVDEMSGGFYLTVPQYVLHDIPKEEQYIRTRGGKAGLEVAKAPHIFWSPTFAAYSDLDFVLPAPQIGLAAPVNDADYLRAAATTPKSIRLPQ